MAAPIVPLSSIGALIEQAGASLESHFLEDRNSARPQLAWQHPVVVDLYLRPLAVSATDLQGAGGSGLLEVAANSRIGALASSLAGEAQELVWNAALNRVPGARLINSGLGMLNAASHALWSSNTVFSALSEALKFVSKLATTASATDTDYASPLSRAAECLRGAIALAKELPSHSKDGERTLEFIIRLVERVRELRVGSALLVPVGWCTASKQGGGGASHVLLFLISRAASGDGFELRVLNAGAGLEYHARCVDEETGGVRINLPLVLRGIDEARLTDPNWWFLVLRPLIFPAASEPTEHAAALRDLARPLYEQLLPYLNGRPVLANISPTDPDASWEPPPASATVGGCGSLVFQAARAALRTVGGLSVAHADQALLLLHTSLLDGEIGRGLDEMLGDALGVEGISTEDATLVHMACRQVAALASAHLRTDLVGVIATRARAEATLEVVGGVQEKLERVLRRTERGTPPLLALPPHQAGEAATETRHGLFGWLLHDRQQVEQLAGRARTPEIMRPVHLAKVQDSVAGYEEAVIALRHTAQLCTRMSHQSMRNAYAGRAALVQHVITATLPTPRPPGSAGFGRCFWQASPMAYEMQVEMLRLLALLARHYATCILSLRPTILADGARLVTLAAIAALADAILRKPTARRDVPSPFSLHFSGAAAGPGRPFGFELSALKEESASMRFHSVRLLTRRTEVLDYFDGVQTQLLGYTEDAPSKPQTLFRFEDAMALGEGDVALLEQITYQVGYPSAADAAAAPSLASYFTGEARELHDDMPEFAALRDIVFYFKVFMAPTAKYLPARRPWRVADAVLRWEARGDGRGDGASLQAKAFSLDGKSFHDFQLNRAYEAKRKRSAGGVGGGGSVVGQAFSFVKAMVNGETPRAEVSAADPSHLAGFETGSGRAIEGEDDVLELPATAHGSGPSLQHTFDRRISDREAELLLTYLTAPYVRIPLLLAFFTPQHRTGLLSMYQVQEMLDAALFEPGAWQPDRPRVPPATVPAQSRDGFATECGLLVNELQHAPAPVARALVEIGKNALDLDMGSFDLQRGSCQTILYALRLLVRAESHVCALLDHAPAPTRSARKTRGMQPSLAARSVLPKLRRELRELLWERYFYVLERWCAKALETRDGARACVLMSHLALLCKNLDGKAMEYREASTLLVAQTYLISFFPWDLDAREADATKDYGRPSRALLVPQDELLDVFQAKRHALLAWLDAPAHRRASHEVMEAVERVVSYTGVRRRSAHDRPARPWQRLGSRLGLSWESCGSSRPMAGHEVLNASLSAALQAKAEFTQAEFDAFRVTGVLHPDSFVQAGGGGGAAATYFKPAASSGRFIPETELATVNEARRATQATTRYRDWWFRVCNEASETEINVELGEFSVKANKMRTLDAEIGAFDDYVAVFGVMGATGLAWRDAGDVRPASSGVEVRSAALAEQLHSGQLHFTAAEFGAFGVSGLQPTSVVKVGGRYFVPAGSQPPQCAVLHDNEFRQSYRLFGKMHDVAHWRADPEAPRLPASWHRTALDASEEWAIALLQTWLPLVLPGLGGRLCMPPSPSGLRLRDGSAAIVQLAGVSAGDADGAEPRLKQIVVHQAPPLVLVFDVVSWGRVPYRTQIFSSDATGERGRRPNQRPPLPLHTPIAARSALASPHLRPLLSTHPIHRPPPSLHTPSSLPSPLFTASLHEPAAASGHMADPKGPPLSAARLSPPPASCVGESLRISRNLGGQTHFGSQTFLPARFLRGLLPDALVEAYRFWQSEEADADSAVLLVGFETAATAAAAVVHHRIRVEISPPPADGADVADAMAIVRREALQDPKPSEEGTKPTAVDQELAAVVEGAAAERHPTLVLANLCEGAALGSALGNLFAVLRRLESLAHVLCWVSDSAGAQLARVELPRLRLSFAAEGGKLLCEQRPGFWLTDRRDDELDRLVAGLPQSVLLENAQAELLVLLPACGKPLPAADGLWLLHGEARWLSALEHVAVRHYVYPVHPCGVLLSSQTLSSSLYLLVCRLFSRRYADAFRLAESCASDSSLSAEEAQLWALLSFAVHDGHPDAYAVRLKLSLVVMGNDVMEVPWSRSLRAQLQAYVLKAGSVSPACRLSAQEELLLLESDEGNGAVPADLYNRHAILRALHESNPDVTLRLHAAQSPLCFEDVWDGTCVAPTPPSSDGDVGGLLETIVKLPASGLDWVQSLTGANSYVRPAVDQCSGGPAAEFLSDALASGTLALGRPLGFLFLYEMLTGSLQFSLFGRDDRQRADEQRKLARLLLRMLPAGDACQKGAAISILRTLAANPGIDVHAANKPTIPRLELRGKLGTVWRDEGTARPTTGAELADALPLIEAIRKYEGERVHANVVLSDADARGLKLKGVRHDSYVQVGSRYYKPAAGPKELLPEVMSYLRERVEQLQWAPGAAGATTSAPRQWPMTAAPPEPATRHEMSTTLWLAPAADGAGGAGTQAVFRGRRSLLVPRAADCACAERELHPSPGLGPRASSKDLPKLRFSYAGKTAPTSGVEAVHAPLAAELQRQFLKGADGPFEFSPSELLKLNAPLDVARHDGFLKSAEGGIEHFFRPVSAVHILADEVRTLSDAPLRELPLADYVEDGDKSWLGSSKTRRDEALPFDLSSHAEAQSKVGKEMTDRIASDVAKYAKQVPELWQLRSLSPKDAERIAGGDRGSAESVIRKLERLHARLTEMHATDRQFVRGAIPHALGLANGTLDESEERAAGDPRGGGFLSLLGLRKKQKAEGRTDDEQRDLLSHALAVLAGTEPAVWFELLVALSMSKDATGALRTFNPYLTDADAERVLDITTAVMLRSVRMSQLMRSLEATGGLLRRLRRLSAAAAPASADKKEALKVELSVASTGLAACLAAERAFVAQPRADGTVVLDPRLLTFEFMSTYLLRGAQVQLIRRFEDAALVRRESLCHQMIMGGGKTTVSTIYLPTSPHTSHHISPHLHRSPRRPPLSMTGDHADARAAPRRRRSLRRAVRARRAARDVARRDARHVCDCHHQGRVHLHVRPLLGRGAHGAAARQAAQRA